LKNEIFLQKFPTRVKIKPEAEAVGLLDVVINHHAKSKKAG